MNIAAVVVRDRVFRASLNRLPEVGERQVVLALFSVNTTAVAKRFVVRFFQRDRLRVIRESRVQVAIHAMHNATVVIEVSRFDCANLLTLTDLNRAIVVGDRSRVVAILDIDIAATGVVVVFIRVIFDHGRIVADQTVTIVINNNIAITNDDVVVVANNRATAIAVVRARTTASCAVSTTTS